MTYLFGSEGHMGKRYGAIMRKLNIPFVGLDPIIDHAELDWSKVTNLILATPTASHLSLLKNADEMAQKLGRRYRILCEKPVVTSKDELTEFRQLRANEIYVVNQYQYLCEILHVPAGRKFDPVSYNYYNTGKDGLAWDCFQLYALSENLPVLGNTSPIWKCQIGRHDISPSSMDLAYVDMIIDFIYFKKGKLWGMDRIIETTEKILNSL